MSVLFGVQCGDMLWLLQPGMTPDCLGLLPDFLQEADPRPARDQIAENHCGGWDSFKGGTLSLGEPGDVKPVGTYSYPGDPDMTPLAVSKLRDEVIFLYPADFVAIVQSDGTYDIARIS